MDSGWAGLAMALGVWIATVGGFGVMVKRNQGDIVRLDDECKACRRGVYKRLDEQVAAQNKSNTHLAKMTGMLEVWMRANGHTDPKRK